MNDLSKIEIFLSSKDFCFKGNFFGTTKCYVKNISEDLEFVFDIGISKKRGDVKYSVIAGARIKSIENIIDRFNNHLASKFGGKPKKDPLYPSVFSMFFDSEENSSCITKAINWATQILVKIENERDEMYDTIIDNILSCQKMNDFSHSLGVALAQRTVTLHHLRGSLSQTLIEKLAATEPEVQVELSRTFGEYISWLKEAHEAD